MKSNSADEFSKERTVEKHETEPELLRPVAAFAKLSISRSRGYEGVARNEIPHVVVAGQIRIPRRWIEQQVERALAK